MSLIGDGIYFVAIAWQVLDISNAATALSVVGIAWTAPHVLLLLLGGAMADRFERRRVLLAADIIRGLAIALAGLLSVLGLIEFWHVLVLVGFVGVGNALFGPSFEAIIPDLVTGEDLVQANSLAALLRPFGMRLVGPALGGVIVALAGAGAALFVDAGTFGVSALALLMMRPPPRPGEPRPFTAKSTLTEIREGFRYVLSLRWLWVTMAAAGIAVFAITGPVQTLVPFLVRNELRLGPSGLGWIFAAQGAGAVVGAIAVGSRARPQRHMTLMFSLWAIGALGVAGFGVASDLWQAMGAGLIYGGFIMTGTILWITLLQAEVPRSLLGRVSSFDWLISTSLVPLSFAVAGPLGEVLGAQMTLLIAGIAAAVPVVVFPLIPGVRAPEERSTGPKAASVESEG